MTLYLKLTHFSDETSILHKHRPSKPNSDASLNKDEKVNLVVKLTLGEQHSQVFPGNHVRGKSNIQTGAKFLAKFLQPHDKSKYPKLGQIFVKNFAKSDPNGTFQVGTTFEKQ